LKITSSGLSCQLQHQFISDWKKDFMKLRICIGLLLAAVVGLIAKPATTTRVNGDYLEVRSCDVYTGPCFANAEMGLAGKEGILVWTVRDGAWNGVALNGLSVIAVVSVNDTLGNVKYQPRHGKAVLIVDAKASAAQKEALTQFARSMAGPLISEVAEIKTSKLEVALGTCSKSGCGKVKAGNLVEISTRCLGDKDHACGNEETYYPPLIDVTGAYPAFTEIAAYKGTGLNLTWESTGQRSAFLASFSR
jgi:hypothetical protein